MILASPDGLTNKLNNGRHKEGNGTSSEFFCLFNTGKTLLQFCLNCLSESTNLVPHTPRIFGRHRNQLPVLGASRTMDYVVAGHNLLLEIPANFDAEPIFEIRYTMKC
jgi:hypothetical protein